MFGGIAKAIFGSSNERYVRSLRKIVECHDAEIHRLRLMVDFHRKGRTAFAAEAAKAEAAGFEGLHLLLASREDQIAHRYGREDHRRRA